MTRESTVPSLDNVPYLPLPDNEVICLRDGRLMSVHNAESCSPESGWCPIHRPSDHLLRSVPLYWDPDRRMMLRRCEHDALHPDPDDLKVRTWPEEGAHECDGCCEVTG